MIKAGFLINPVAGCGQFLNMKGSDSLTPSQCPRSISLEKAIEFLNESRDLDVLYYTASGQMGEEAFQKTGLRNYEVIEHHAGESTPENTEEFIRNLLGTDASILVFFGGDGTARDIYDAGWALPSLGVPLGTKMYSSVFALSVSKATQAFMDYVSSGTGDFEMEEVIDLDEDAYIKGDIEVKQHGKLLVPVSDLIMSSSKAEYQESSDTGIAEYVVEHMEKDVNYLVGPGSTCKAILSELNLEGSILGFDLVRNGEVRGKDLSEKEIFELTSCRTVIVLSPIGGQGFLLGRGNKQLSGRIISAVGFENIIVVSSEVKMRSLNRLYVDMDSITIAKPSFLRVLFGYGRYRMMPVLF